MCKNLCGLDYKIIGAEKIPKKKGIVFIKHSSVYELFVGLLLFSPSSWVAKHELMYLPLFRNAIKVFGFIPVKRGLGKSEVSRVIRDGTARLGEEKWIVIFPEGTRVPHGKTKRYGLSGALLAVGTGSNITPIAHNAGRYWGRRSLIKKRGSIVFSVGNRISTLGKSYDEVNEEAKTWIDAETKRIDGF
jgi:1-acyl-sn-glycerol-3-phosphate acyltransferase